MVRGTALWLFSITSVLLIETETFPSRSIMEDRTLNSRDSVMPPYSIRLRVTAFVREKCTPEWNQTQLYDNPLFLIKIPPQWGPGTSREVKPDASTTNP